MRLHRWPSSLVLAGVVVAGLGRAAAAPLEARFIGNAAVAISDGSTTLVSDFPYHSGAFGYMTYRFDDVRLGGRVLCLITHGHDDHFDAGRFASTTWTVIAPPSVTRGLPAARVVPFAEHMRFGPLAITAIRTAHGPIDHDSYRVRWGDRELYFTGDTDDEAALVAQHDLDVAFVTPWLWKKVHDRGGRIDARRVVIYHHRAGEAVPACSGACVVPRQGELLTLPPRG